MFSLGFSPCFAVLPVFATAVGLGSSVLIGSMAAFAVGVVAALIYAGVPVNPNDPDGNDPQVGVNAVVVNVSLWS